MKKKNIFKSEEMEFFKLVSQVVTTNPFTDERADLDLKITNLPISASRYEIIKAMINIVNERIKGLESNGFFNLKDFDDENKKIMEKVYLFQFFHNFIETFDELINNQIKEGDKPIKVTFADEAISYLKNKGFYIDAARRFFALAYQIRRAFFFIDRSLMGKSNSMKFLRRNLWNNVFTYDLNLYDKHLWNRMEDFSTLILGETGTGKGTSAAAIGRSGFIPFDEKKGIFTESFAKNFISLNISQFPESLIESELFGHKKGSFTGAIDDYKGIFDICSPYGSIFLDEIGEISIPIQIKLLQILQERIFSPVGSHQKKRFQGRVIAATNKSIDELKKKKIFRDDFFYRLCSDIIIVPSLNERISEDKEELNDLIKFTVEKMIGVPSEELSEMIKQIIIEKLGINYSWPGNVRELEQCIRRIFLKRNYEGNISDISNDKDLESVLLEKIKNGSIDSQSLLSNYCALLYKRHGTYEEVATRTMLDRRTVKKYIQDIL
ncbi:MAG: sigma-54-dependent Fis family transcriptional regulator [Desulfobacterales bacterium]|nr:sigma-54-dependent Fis family transcriptional regulator [Desulfobacterales bacterium]